MEKLLLGPGPSNLTQEVRRGLSQPAIGHLDPEFLAILDETCDLLRWIFKTDNKVTFPLTASGSGAMEATAMNLVEDGTKVVIGINGAFSLRAKEMLSRLGAQVIEVVSPWGSPLDIDEINKAVKIHKPQILWLVHGETSTGVLNSVESVKKEESIFVVDCVTSLGGVDFRMDEWGIDVAFSGTQKCLNVPPGLAPISFSSQAMEVLKPSKSWYFDLSLIAEYILSDGPRTYHHTAPINMIFGLLASLKRIKSIGLDDVFIQHLNAAEFLYSKFEKMGFDLVVDRKFRLPQLTTVYIPEDLRSKETNIRSRLLNDFNIEIGGGLGVLANKIWRIGLMGINANIKNVELLIDSLNQLLNEIN